MIAAVQGNCQIFRTGEKDNLLKERLYSWDYKEHFLHIYCFWGSTYREQIMKRFIIALLIGLVSAGVTFADPHKNESGKGHGKHDKHRDKWEEKNWKEANKFEDKARERSEKALKEQRKEAEKYWKEQEKWNARNAPPFIPRYDLPQAAPPEIYNWPGIEPAYQQYGPPMPPAPPVVEYFYPSDYRQYPNRGAETGARLGAKIGWMLGGAQGAALGADIGHEIGLEVPDR